MMSALENVLTALIGVLPIFSVPLAVLSIFAVPPAIVGCFVGAGLHSEGNSPLQSLLSGNGLPADYRALGLAFLFGVPILLAPLLWKSLDEFVRKEIMPSLIGGAGLLGYIFGSFFVDFVAQHLRMFSLFALGTDVFILCCFVVEGDFLKSKYAKDVLPWLSLGLFFSFPAALIMAIFGAYNHLHGTPPLYQALQEHGVLSIYHSVIFGISLGVPVLTGFLVVLKGPASLQERVKGKEIYFLIAGGAIAGYAIGAIMGDMAKNYFGWVLLVHTIISLFFIASCADTYFFESWNGI